MKTNGKGRFTIRAIIFGGFVALTLGGCAMPNSSNPTVAITSAQVRGDRATLDLQIENPSDMNVEIDSMRWTLNYGPLPTAEGIWALNALLESNGTYRFTREVRFTNPVLDPSADTLELSGTLDIKTEGDKGDMGLAGAAFVTTAKVQH